MNLEQIQNLISDVNDMLNSDSIETGVKLDSIVNSHKLHSGYREESSPWFISNFDLGNYLAYRSHHLDSRLIVSYSSFRVEPQVVEVKFTLYSYESEIDTSELIAFAKTLNLEVWGDYSQISIFKTVPRIQNFLSSYFPKINFKVKTKKKELIFQTDYINNSVNHLVYGIACSIDGEAPYGLYVMANLNHYKEYDTIEKLLFSPNPVTRLYAAVTLEYLDRKSIYKWKEDSNIQMKSIFDENIKIEICNGCSYSNMSMKDAKILLQRGMENPFDSFLFFDN
ncbi:MAG: hypothetical protein JST55_10295 [Bacteroidetes bacterium]|nr:hypothetical protein [Bacteroidota bacterium]